MNPRVKFIRKATGEKNFLDEIRNTKRQVNRMETAEGLDSSVNETEQNLFMDTNETIITNGRLVTTGAESETAVAEEDGFTGTVVSGNGVTPFDEAGTFNLAVINDGETTYGVGKSGTYSNGMDFFNRQLATGTSTDQRQLRSGFQELQGNDDPSYIFEFLDTAVGANLITSNPDFETGDATGWTLSSGTQVIATSSLGINAPSDWGSYCLKLDVDLNDSATSSKYSCSAGSTLNVNFQVRCDPFPDTSVYIRFYNSVPTLLSTVLIKTFTVGYATVGYISSQVVVPSGATQFDIYVLRTTANTTAFYCDNFSVTVVSISNEFGFHGEDGQILMGNGKFKTNDLGAYIPRGSLSGVVYANNTKTTISTSGQTTVFGITVPANFFTKGQLRFSCEGFVEPNGNNRTLTSRLIVGGTTLSFSNNTSVATNYVHKWEGSIGFDSTDNQNVFLTQYRTEDNGAVDGFVRKLIGTASNDDASTISVSFTLQLSGSVTLGWFNNVVVESIMNTDVW